MINQTAGIIIVEVYVEDSHGILGKYLEKDGLTYQFVKFAAGTIADKGDALTVSPLYVAARTTVATIQGICPVNVNAWDVIQYTLVVVDTTKAALTWVNANPGSNTALSAESWDGLPLSCSNSAASASCRAGKLTTAATAAFTTSTSAVEEVSVAINANFAANATNMAILQKCNAIAISAGSAFTADSANVSCRTSFMPYYTTDLGATLQGVTADLPTGASALLASADFQVGDVVTIDGVNRTVTAVSGISAITVSAFPATGFLTATASAFSASGGAEYLTINKYRVPMRFIK
jgi:hypothetical protein